MDHTTLLYSLNVSSKVINVNRYYQNFILFEWNLFMEESKINDNTVLLYGSEALNWKRNDDCRLNSEEMRSLRLMYCGNPEGRQGCKRNG